MSSVAHARGLCHWKYFLGVLERRRRTHRCEHVYVISSDSSEAQVELRAALGEGVYIPHLPEHSACTGSMFRSRLCIQLAFAELLLLSKTTSLVYSTSSSFSEWHFSWVSLTLKLRRVVVVLFEICTCDGHTPSHTYDDRWHSFILSKVYDITYSTTNKARKNKSKIFNRYPIDPETRECTRESGKDGASWITSHEGSRTPGNLSPPYRSTTHLLRSRKGHAPLIRKKNRLAIGSYGQTPSKVEPLLFQHTTPRRGRARRAINNASMPPTSHKVRVSWPTEVYWFTEIYASASWS